MRLRERAVTPVGLIVTVSLWYLVAYNATYFEAVDKVYPFAKHGAFVLSTAVVIWALHVFVFTLFIPRFLLKPVLIVITMIAAAAAYFMQTYHIVIDESMIRNVLQTDAAETRDLITPKLIGYLFFLGVLPSFLIARIPLKKESWKRAVWQRIKTIVLSLLLIAVILLAFSKHYASFFREHRPLRYEVNPMYWIYNLSLYTYHQFVTTRTELKRIGLDARIVDDGKPPRLVIMVVGEAARADHFSLNGYARETNPKLSKEAIINFERMYSCGTSTAASVPCMFSVYTREEYSDTKGHTTENVLDVLKHTHRVALLWRDNNSDSKGVALRIRHENFKTPQNNPVCIEGECRDIGMLSGLEKFIAAHPKQDILIVLHQMGNHGPAYYKRYPSGFEHFKPVCRSSQLETCSRESIVNAYDNALRYTDDFLARVIAFLKRYDGSYRTAMLYMADHGESLGEHGIYLHGMPYFIAPEAQKHIGALFWFGKQFSDDPRIKVLAAAHAKRFSHDHLFHTLLGLFNVETDAYDKNLDMLALPQRSTTR